MSIQDTGMEGRVKYVSHMKYSRTYSKPKQCKTTGPNCNLFGLWTAKTHSLKGRKRVVALPMAGA